MVRLHRVLGWLGVCALGQALSAQQPMSLGPANLGGTLYASSFARWTVAQGTNGPLSWSNPSVCTTANTGSTSVRPFTVGTQVKIVDTANAALSENVTVTNVQINGSGCSISIVPNNPHFGFYLTSATAGLQEAINSARCQSAVVTLTPDWIALGGTTAMIQAAQGCAAVTIEDARTAQRAAFVYSGSGYVLVPAAATVTGQQFTLPAFTGSGSGTNTALGPTSIKIDPTGNYLSAKAVNGQRSAMAYEAVSGVTADGIVGALADCVPGQPCTVVAPAGYPVTDGTTPTGVAQLLVNNSTGGDLQASSNPLSAPDGGGWTFFQHDCGKQPLSRALAPLNLYEENCNVSQYTDSAPWGDYGYSTPPSAPLPGGGEDYLRSGARGWLTAAHTKNTYTVKGGALSALFNNAYTCAGPADCLYFNADPLITYGNTLKAADEGMDYFRGRGHEADTTYFGTTTQGGVGQAQLYMTALVDANNMGTYRTMVDMTTPPLAGRADGFTYDDAGRIMRIVDSTANFPVSTAVGTLTHDIIVQNRIQMPIGTLKVCTVVPLTVTSGTFAVGDLIGFDSSAHEFAKLLSACPAWSATYSYNHGEGTVYSGVAYTAVADNILNQPPPNTALWRAETADTTHKLFGANLAESHTAASRVYANGMAGRTLEFEANYGDYGLIYPSEIVGSIDSHTLAAAWFFAGNDAYQFQFGNLNSSSQSMYNVTVATGGAATLVIGGGGVNLLYVNQAVVSLSGNANPALNGLYAAPLNNRDGASYTATLCQETTWTGSCTPSAVTGTGLGGNMTIGDTGVGNTRYLIRCGAQVLDVNDYRATGKVTSNGTAAKLEDNACAWPVGGTVMEAHFYQQQLKGFDISMSSHNPYTESPGYFNAYDNGSGSYNQLAGSHCLYCVGSDYNPASLMGGGGTKYAMDVIGDAGGLHGHVLHMQSPPGTSYQALYKVDSLPNYPDRNPFFTTFLWDLPWGNPNIQGYCRAPYTWATGELDITCPTVRIPGLVLPNTIQIGATGTGVYQFADRAYPQLTPIASGGQVNAKIGGYYSGFALQSGSRSTDAVNPSLVIQNADDTNTGNYGPGASSFAVTNRNVVTTRNNTLDDGLGGAALSGALTAGSLKAGAGVVIANTSLLPQVGTPTVGQAACIKASGPPVVIGYCSTVVSATGGCTCN